MAEKFTPTDIFCESSMRFSRLQLVRFLHNITSAIVYNLAIDSGDESRIAKATENLSHDMNTLRKNHINRHGLVGHWTIQEFIHTITHR